MCDRGEIVCVHVGSHRRVPSSEVERVTSRRLTREEERSLWLHRALLSPLLTEPDTVVSAARENLRRWSGMHRRDGMAGWYFTKWQRVLNDGLDAVMHVLTSPSEDAREMRQNSRSRAYCRRRRGSRCCGRSRITGIASTSGP